MGTTISSPRNRRCSCPRPSSYSSPDPLHSIAHTFQHFNKALSLVALNLDFSLHSTSLSVLRPCLITVGGALHSFALLSKKPARQVVWRVRDGVDARLFANEAPSTH
jgi:hypothetical protein